jgi:ferritin-like protein
VHTTDYKVMLQEVLKTEETAAETYKGILDNTADNQELYDLIEQIYFAEVRSTEELNQLI